MIEKYPLETQGNEQEDLLEQIIAQGLEKIKAPVPAEAAAEVPADDKPPAPGQKDGGEAAPPTDRRNKTDRVYFYLLILFGTAFLLLLLAYFFQQRSNESTISDLQESMNLSREELLDEIRELKEQNAALQELYESQRTEISERMGSYDALVAEHYATLEKLSAQLYSWQSFWTLDQYYQVGDYESCAAVLLLQWQSQYTYITPDAVRERYAEITRAVIDSGILAEDYYRHPDHYGDLLDAYLRTKVSWE